MPIHPQAQAVIDGNGWSTLDPAVVGVDTLRQAMNTRLIELAGVGPALHAVTDDLIDSGTGQIPVRIYQPVAPDTPLPVFIYFHSGGYCVYDIDTADAQCRTIALETRCIVLSVGYRLAPEAKFPAAVDDAWAALQWAASSPAALNADPARIAIGGESCGGTLATVCALLARDGNGPALRLVVLSCALLEMGRRDPLAPPSLAGWMRDQYLGDPNDADDFRASPLRHPDLGRLPPHLILTGEFDGLRGQCAAYAAKLDAAGTTVTFKEFPGMIHNFTGMGAALDDAAHGISMISAGLRSALGD
ncbi:MAG: alpha/beta hydrolase [Alphaproteobacteria bacterium]